MTSPESPRAHEADAEDAAASDEPTLRLRIVACPDPGLIGREIEVGAGELWIGRAEGCDLVVGDPNVSRRHARLVRTEEGLFLEDNGSANGTLLGGERIGKAELQPGARFTLGATSFELLREEGPEEAAAGPAVFERTMAIENFDEIVAQFQAPTSLAEQGEEVVTAANRPLLLDDPNSLWLVQSGKVEVFTVAVEDGRPTGARTHFLTVEPGEAFFGLDTERFGWDAGFLAVGKAGSKLRRFAVDRVQLLAKVPAHREVIAGLVDTWVRGLSERLVEDLPHVPEPEIRLRVGEATEIPEEKKVAPAEPILWLDMPSARFLFDDMAALSYEVEGLLFPVARGSWLELLSSDDEVELVPEGTAERIGDPRLWAGLEAFHRVLCECEFLNKKLAAVDEYQRLERKAEQAEEAREVAFGAIESVLGGTEVWERPQGAVGDLGPVLTASAAVADHEKIRIEQPRNLSPDATFDEAVQAISAASRFRIRRIALADDWWARDQGAVLGQREESKTPVALIPSSPSSYRYFDPVSGESGKVTEAVVETLSPFGYVFYRPFPDGHLTARGLIKFGVQGLGRDFREVALLGVGLGFLSTVAPLITGMVFDTAIPEAERGMLIQFTLGLFLVALATGAFKITQNIAMLRVQGKMDYTVQAAIWDRLMDLPLPFFRDYSSGDLADRASGVDQIRAIIAGAGVSAILGSIASLFNAVQMAIYSFKLALVGIGLTLVYVMLTVAANYFQLRLQRDELRRHGKITGLVLQLITGVSKMRVSGSEDHAFRVWATEFAGARKVGFSVGRVQNFVQVLNSGFMVLATLAIFFTLTSLQRTAAERGEAFDLSTGDFLAFSAAFGIFLGAMQALGDASVNMLKVVPVYERLQPIVTTDSEIDGSKAHPGKLKGGIELSHVQFRYSEDGPWVIRDLSLEIEPGEFVAFVGGSGCGKSTLMRLMLGFELPVQGAVYYDGQDLSTLDLRMVRQQLGVVLQDSKLLPADIFRNIVGASSRTVADAWEAARKAGIADDIKAMPMGMHTYVMEGGGGFSGGQKQRLMIARAIVHEPKILFLDEATSALDNRTQQIVTESMDRLDATRIVIAHRLSTIVGADKICYLEAGKIAEMGTYDELMELDGQFAELARRQLA